MIFGKNISQEAHVKDMKTGDHKHKGGPFKSNFNNYQQTSNSKCKALSVLLETQVQKLK